MVIRTVHNQATGNAGTFSGMTCSAQVKKWLIEDIGILQSPDGIERRVVKGEAFVDMQNHDLITEMIGQLAHMELVDDQGLKRSGTCRITGVTDLDVEFEMILPRH